MEMRVIPGILGYLATNTGDIYSQLSGKIISQFIDNTGYKQVILYINGKRCYKRVHRLIALAFVPNPNFYPMVNHKNGNKLDNNLYNLEWCTNRYNTQEAYNCGLYPTTRSVPVYVKDPITGMLYIFNSVRECSDTLPVNRKTVSRILKGEKVNNYPYIIKPFYLNNYCV